MKLFQFIVVVSLLCACRTEASTSDYTVDDLIEAIIQVESGGDDEAIGDRHLRQKAYGPMQIRQPCVDDVNERCGTTYQAEDMLGNRGLSIQCFHVYMERYAIQRRLGYEPTLEDMARIWNGGPNGYKKASTEEYWQKVQEALQEEE